MNYILNQSGEVQAEPDIKKWAVWFDNFKNRSIEQTKIEPNVLVSTVFIGIDYRFAGSGPPLVFETMVFKDGDEVDCERHCTLQEAKDRHKEMVQKWSTSV